MSTSAADGVRAGSPTNPSSVRYRLVSRRASRDLETNVAWAAAYFSAWISRYSLVPEYTITRSGAYGLTVGSTRTRTGGDGNEPVEEGDEIVAVAAAAIAVPLEQLDRVVHHVLDMSGVAKRECGEFLDRHTLAHQGASGDEHVDGIGGEALGSGFALGHEQPGADHDADDELGHIRQIGQCGPVEFGVDRIRPGQFGQQTVG